MVKINLYVVFSGVLLRLGKRNAKQRLMVWQEAGAIDAG